MKETRRMAYLDISGDMLVEFFKKINSNLPKDAKLIAIKELDSSSHEACRYNCVRFFLESEEFYECNEGACPQKFVLVVQNSNV